MNTSTPPIRSTSLPDVFPADIDDALEADPGELLDLLRERGRVGATVQDVDPVHLVDVGDDAPDVGGNVEERPFAGVGVVEELLEEERLLPLGEDEQRGERELLLQGVGDLVDAQLQVQVHTRSEDDHHDENEQDDASIGPTAPAVKHAR